MLPRGRRRPRHDTVMLMFQQVPRRQHARRLVFAGLFLALLLRLLLDRRQAAGTHPLFEMRW